MFVYICLISVSYNNLPSFCGCKDRKKYLNFKNDFSGKFDLEIKKPPDLNQSGSCLCTDRLIFILLKTFFKILTAKKSIDYNLITQIRYRLKLF